MAPRRAQGGRHAVAAADAAWRHAVGIADMKGIDPALLACTKVDVHTHIGEEYIEGSRKLGIGPLWISRPFTGTGHQVPSTEVMAEANRMVADAVKAHPGVLFGYLFAHAGHLAWSVAEMDKWLSLPGMVGVKLYHQYLFDDPAVVALVREAARRNAVVLLHQGKATDAKTVDALKAAPGLHFDTARMRNSVPLHLSDLVRAVGKERFLLGTGMPFLVPEAPLLRLAMLEDEAARAAVGAGNFRRLFD